MDGYAGGKYKCERTEKADLIRTIDLLLPITGRLGLEDAGSALQSLVAELGARKKDKLELPKNPKALCTSSLKGIVRRALAAFPFVLVLDHVAGPPRVVTAMIKEFNDYEQRPHSSLNYLTPAEFAVKTSYAKVENAQGVSHFHTAAAAAG